MTSASCPKSSSARRLYRELGEQLAGAQPLTERRAALRDVGEQRERGEVALDHVVDAGPLDLHDDRLAGAQAGAVRLADRRRGERLPVELGEHLVDRAAELGLEARPDLLDRLGRDPVLQRRELVAHLGRDEVDAGRRDLAELHVDAAGLLEHAPQAHADGIRRCARRCRRGGEERAEPLAARQAHQLAVAAQHRDPRLHRPHRAGRDDEPGALADGQRARAGEQVERDRHRHRRGDPDGDHAQRGARRRPSPSRRRPNARNAAMAQPMPPGDQRRAPPAPDPEQPQRERGRDDRDARSPRCASTTTRSTTPTEAHREHHHDPPVHGGAGAAEREVVASRDLGHEVAAGLERERAVGVGEERRRLASPSNANS